MKLKQGGVACGSAQFRKGKGKADRQTDGQTDRQTLFLAILLICRLSMVGYIIEVLPNYNNLVLLLGALLQQGISEPIFYGDLVYKFKRIVRKPNFSDQFKKIVKRYLRFGYNLDIMRQSACLVLNPITVYSYGFLFNCTTVGQASDSMKALT